MANKRGIYNKFVMPVQGVSVYDVNDKKLIGIFRSTREASKYFFPRKINKYSGDVHRYITTKSKNYTNCFKRVLAFRWAKVEQGGILQGDNYVIFDDNYKK